MKKALLAITLGAVALPAAPALADPPPWAPAHGYRAKHGNAIAYRTTDNGIRYWQGDDGRYYCKRSNGTTGLLVGAALGAWIAGSVADRLGRIRVMQIAAILFMGFGVYVLVRPEEFLAYVGLGSGTDQGELTMLLGIAGAGAARDHTQPGIRPLTRFRRHFQHLERRLARGGGRRPTRSGATSDC